MKIQEDSKQWQDELFVRRFESDVGRAREKASYAGRNWGSREYSKEINLYSSKVN
jgi:hypothetical protein